MSTALPHCYHGNISKTEAKILLTPRPFGAFLLRDSGTTDAAYTLSFRSFDQVLHVRIYQTKADGSYYLDAPRTKRQKFCSVLELIQFCMNLDRGMKAVNQKHTDDVFYLTEPLECLNNLNSNPSHQDNNSCRSNHHHDNNNVIVNNDHDNQPVPLQSSGPVQGLQLLKTIL